MSLVYEVDFPFPDSRLNPNKRIHYHQKAKLKKKQFNECYILAKQYTCKVKKGKIPLLITFHQPTRHNRDIDNMLSSCKSLIDGMANALGVDDRVFRPITLDDGEIIKGGKVTVKILS